MTGLQVDTGALRDAAARLELVAERSVAAGLRAARADWLPAVLLVPPVAGVAAVAGAGGAALAARLAAQGAGAWVLARRLRLAADLYEQAEAFAVEAGRTAGGLIAWLHGRFAPFVVLRGTMAAATLLFVCGVQQRLAHATGEPLTSAAFFEQLGARVNLQPIIRGLVEHVDEAAVGLAGLPIAALPLLPERAAARAAGSILELAGGLGLVTAAGFRVSDHRRTPARARPGGPSAATLIAAIPQAEDGRHQVTVTSYRTPQGELVYTVAITGTSSQGLDTSQPFDNLGNLAAYGGSPEQSVTAVRLALAEAGVPDGALIALAGYSQGAIVAQSLAASGSYRVAALVTVGTPSRPAGVPETVPMAEIEHPADPIVGLQGLRPADADGASIVRVTPRLDARDPGHHGILAEHALDAYQDSVQRLTDAADPRLAEVDAALGAAFQGAQPLDTQRITIERERPG